MMKNVKRGVELILGVEWESSLAKHYDEYYCKVNVWRECELFPKEFRPLIEEGQ